LLSGAEKYALFGSVYGECSAGSDALGCLSIPLAQTGAMCLLPLADGWGQPEEVPLASDLPDSHQNSLRSEKYEVTSSMPPVSNAWSPPALRGQGKRGLPPLLYQPAPPFFLLGLLYLCSLFPPAIPAMAQK
jgi:hypothetical protein